MKCNLKHHSFQKKMKNFENYLSGRITHIQNLKEKGLKSISISEHLLLIEEILEKFKSFNIELQARINLEYPSINWKGKSQLRFERLPKLWIISEFRKESPEIKPRELHHEIPLENVMRVFNILLSLNDKEIKVRDFAELLAKTYRDDFEEFFIDGAFSYETFFGTRGKMFKTLFYPLKIFEHLKVIEYSKRGIIQKIKSNLEIQVMFLNIR